MSDGPLLRPEEVADVLGVGGEGRAPSTPGGPVPYSLREPIAIAPADEARARERARAIVEAFCTALRGRAGEEFKLELEGFVQQRAGAALGTLPPPAWVLPLARRAGGGGVALALHPAGALALVERVLGGPGSPAEQLREPTPVELRIAGRLLAASVDGVAAAIGAPMAALDPLTGRLPPAVAAEGETVGVALLRFGTPAGERPALLLASAALLGPAPAPAAEQHPLGPLAAVLRRVAVGVRPVIPAGRVTLHDLAALTPGTVLQLAAAADAPLELRVAGQRIFNGRIRRTDGGSSFSVLGRRGRSAAAKEGR